MSPSRLPVAVFEADGRVRVAVWRRSRGPHAYAVELWRLMESDADWRRAEVFASEDLPALVSALLAARAWLDGKGAAPSL